MPRRKFGPKTTPGRKPGRGLRPKRKKDSKDPRFGLEFKQGTPPLGTSDHIDNPVIAIEVKRGGMAGKKSGPPPKSGPTPHGMRDGGDAKIKKVIGGLKKASKLHAGQAKTLSSVIKKAKGGIATGCGKIMGDRRKVTKYY